MVIVYPFCKREMRRKPHMRCGFNALSAFALFSTKRRTVTSQTRRLRAAFGKSGAACTAACAGHPRAERLTSRRFGYIIEQMFDLAPAARGSSRTSPADGRSPIGPAGLPPRRALDNRGGRHPRGHPLRCPPRRVMCGCPSAVDIPGASAPLSRGQPAVRFRGVAAPVVRFHRECEHLVSARGGASGRDLAGQGAASRFPAAAPPRGARACGASQSLGASWRLL